MILNRLRAGGNYNRHPEMCEVIFHTNNHLANKILEELQYDPDYIAFMEKYKQALRKAMKESLDSCIKFGKGG